MPSYLGPPTLSDRPLRRLPGVQERAERRGERLVGQESDVVIAALAALLADAVQEILHCFLIRSSERPGLGKEFLLALDVAEDGRPVEGELHLVPVEHLQDE